MRIISDTSGLIESAFRAALHDRECGGIRSNTELGWKQGPCVIGNDSSVFSSSKHELCDDRYDVPQRPTAGR